MYGTLLFILLSLYSCPRTAIVPQTRWLNNKICVLIALMDRSLKWRFSRVMFHSKSPVENPSLPLPACGTSKPFLAWDSITPISASSHGHLLFASVFLLLASKDTGHMGSRTHPILGCSHLITSAKPYFQIRSQSQVWGVWTSTYLLRKYSLTHSYHYCCQISKSLNGGFVMWDKRRSLLSCRSPG